MTAELEQASDLLNDALSEYPQDDEHLIDWIQVITGKKLPYRPVCDEHQTSGQLICDLFFHRISDAIALAARSTGKTAGEAQLHLANAYHKRGFLTTHFGATDTQAQRAYQEYRAYTDGNDFLKDRMLESQTKKSFWVNGSSIEILPGTETQTQGPHSHICTFDELESGKYVPYENSKSIPMEYRFNKMERVPGQFLATSTRNTSQGLMQRALDEAEKSDRIKVYTWCVLESMEPCDGKDGRHLCNFSECPIASDCGKCTDCEDDHGRVYHADGWRSWLDIVTLYDRVGDDTWQAQHLCKKPLAKSLIYSNFSELNIDEQATYIPGEGPLYVFFDWGFTDPTHICFLQLRGNTFYQFAELRDSRISERDWVRSIIRVISSLDGYEGPSYEDWERYWEEGYPNDLVWPEFPTVIGDTNAVQFIFELKEHGFSVVPTKRTRHKIEAGQDVLRAAIKVGSGTIRYKVHPVCSETIRDLQNYRAKEQSDGTFSELPDISPGNHHYSHACDALRYGFFGVRILLGLTDALDS